MWAVLLVGMRAVTMVVCWVELSALRPVVPMVVRTVVYWVDKLAELKVSPLAVRTVVMMVDP